MSKNTPTKVQKKPFSKAVKQVYL